MKRGVIISGAVLLCFMALRCSGPEPAKVTGPRPNLLIILVDALRYDDLGIYGCPRDTSPFLDAWAKKGLVFTNAFSHSSHTKISVAALFTGLLPPANGIRRAAEAEEVLSSVRPTSDVLAPELTTMAEFFRANGYRTYGLITNPHLLASMGFDQGFEQYEYLHGGPRAMLVNLTALAWFRANRARPFFAYIHYMDVHAPYRPPPDYEIKFTLHLAKAELEIENGPYKGEVSEGQIAYARALYDAQVRYWDDEFKKFMAGLEDAGALNNTMVVVISDHGEEFHEHGGFGHGYTVYDEMIHVPMILVWPGHVPDGLERTDLVQLIDLFPTLARLAGLDPSALPLQGRDLFHNGFRGKTRLSFLFPQAAPPVYAETFQGKMPRCLRSEHDKTILDFADQSAEFYDLERDPQEAQNLFTTSPAQAEPVLTLLKQMSGAKPLVKQLEAKELDEKTIKELKSIGYIHH